MYKKSEMSYKEYLYDFSVDGGAVSTINLKPCDPNGGALEEGDLIMDATLIAEAAVTSDGTPTIKFGNGADDDGFFVDTLAKVSVLNTTVRAGELDGALLWDTTNDAKKAYRVGSSNQKPQMAIGTAALTAGKIRLILAVYKPGTAKGYSV